MNVKNKRFFIGIIHFVKNLETSVFKLKEFKNIKWNVDGRDILLLSILLMNILNFRFTPSSISNKSTYTI